MRFVKTIILAGGLGSRISEETSDKPKPMVLLDDKPIIWHIMNVFASQGFDQFLIATGYKSEVIETWADRLSNHWDVEVLNTGLDANTGGRIKKCLEAYPGSRVFMTYGDGLANVNLSSLLQFHKNEKRLVTVTAVRPPARFGVIEARDGKVVHFGEKNQTDAGWINGGFFVLEPDAADLLNGDKQSFESEVLPKLVEMGELSSFQHEGFWQPMDTLREKTLLSELLLSGATPWLEK